MSSVHGFWVNFKSHAFIQSFFLLPESITEIRCKPVFFNFFQLLTVEAVFPASENGFPIECYSFQQVEKDFFV